MSIRFEGRLAALAFFVVSLVCGRAAADAASPSPSSLGRDLATFEAPAEPAPAVLPATPEPVGALRLRDALAAALLGSPELAAQAYEIRARESAALQAGLRPNPELELALEDFAGTGAYHGLRTSESTLRIGQLVELGGKRSARLRLAQRERDLAGFDFETKRLDVLTHTTIAFLDLLQAQEDLATSDDGVRVAHELVAAADERARAGAGAPDESGRFRVALSRAEIDRRRAQRAVEASRRRLAASWGSETPRFAHAEGDLATVAAPPPIAALRARILESPDLLRWESELAARAERVDLERSRGVPDVRIGPGVRWYAGSDDAALVLGASLPLPLWNRNQGAVAEARHRLAKVAAERRAAEIRFGADLAAAHALAAAAQAEAETLQRDVLPQAEQSYRTVRTAYDSGRLGALDVLEAQRTRLGLRAQRLHALGDYHRAVAEIERLLGAPIDADLTPTAPSIPRAGETR